MAITPDQRAVLQLLLERGQSYSDLATLLAVDESEVRSRARAALTELGGGDPDRNVGLTDYLLGQADPIGRADVVRHLQSDPDDHQLAADLAAILREAFPSAELPRLPGEPRQPRRARRGAEAQAAVGSRLPSLSLSQSQTRLVAILGAAAVILIAAVLGITGAFGGGDDSTDEASVATTTEANAADGTTVPLLLEAEAGSDARGAVIFGLAGTDQPFVQFQIRNLEPPSQGDAYVLWFLLGEGKAFPLPTRLEVTENGELSDRIPVPATVFQFLQAAKSIAIALNDAQQVDDAINEAVQQQQGALDYPGGTVMSANIREATQGGGDSSAGS